MKHWKHKLPLKDIWPDYQEAMDGDASAIGKRVAERMREQPWFADYDELEYIAEGFEDVENLIEFDGVLADLYDWGDERKRCWVETF